LQCATLGLKYLGESCDIHIAGRELIFPLHENQIAIATALNKKPPARFWLHCDRVLVGGKKMDGYEGHPTIRSLMAEGWSGREIRYWLLSVHYRKPVIYAPERLQDARRALRRLDACLAMLRQIASGQLFGELDQLLYDLKTGFIDAMDDDLNISVAMASIFKVIKQVNLLAAERRLAPEQVPGILKAFRAINDVVRIFRFETAGDDASVRELVHRRERARAARDWTLADRIREELIGMGIDVRDSKMGSL
jgi:cysteinyl-tRNA synthetase